MTHLNDEIGTRRAHLRKQRNSSPPANQLPVEILRVIVEHAVLPDDLGNVSHAPLHMALLSAAAVCRVDGEKF